ncbi:MAG TPA: hypothetical protein VKG26_00890 [Bacteroidia bacterium]|nr:hypothetical protein [Bacteroidia bacterium]
MDDIQTILLSGFLLTPVIVFLYLIDKKIKPLLIKTRHIFLYLTAVDFLFFIYAIAINYLAKHLGLDGFINTPIYGIYMASLMFGTYIFFITGFLWGLYFINKLINKAKKTKIN